MIAISSKKCIICNAGKKNDTLYWHQDAETKDIWCYCNKCDRGYSIQSYCFHAGISLSDFLKLDFEFKESTPNEVTKIEWPRSFIPLSDPRAKKAVDYVRSRGLKVEGDMYYDTEDEGIVFPYYFDNVFVGAQVRFIETRINEDGEEWKITTLPGTRLGLLFYGWDQTNIPANVQGVIITEGAFNAIALQQALSEVYGGLYGCPWRVFAASGSGASEAQRETLKEIQDRGIKVIIAPDSDEAGIKMLQKYAKSETGTHYALTMNDTKDWNDLLKDMSHKELGMFLLKQIKDINEIR